MPPLIALTTWKRRYPTYWDHATPQYTLDADYVAAVHRAGGVPILLTRHDVDEVDRILDAVDGLVVTGGPDMTPAAYGAKQHPETVDSDAAADAAELALLRGAGERGLPTLGVCRGLQVLNVALGGTLAQHVHSDGGVHRPNPTDLAENPRHGHDVAVAEGSRLAALLGATAVWANSFHHQAIERLAGGLVPVAWAPDGLVEAVEPAGPWPCLAVQWHPEKGTGGGDALFAALVADASRRGVPASAA